MSCAQRNSQQAFLPNYGRKSVFLLAYQSLGVVYGELGISPLYVFRRTFAEDLNDPRSNVEVYGVLSFIFWTLTMIPLIKYVFIVLRASDNGEGGTFALYSLICRHANVSLLPNKHASDKDLSTFTLDQCHTETEHICRFKAWIERHKSLNTALLVVVMLGTGLVIGDGVLIPAISIFSAVEGLTLSGSQHEVKISTDLKLPLTCLIIVCLFVLQHYGTQRIGHLFAPIILIWLLCITGLGLYNIVCSNTDIYKAISPYYMYKFLKETKASGWKSLGGIVLCVTGSEAMFGDLGHFSFNAIQIAFTGIVYPALIFVYMGQAAYLSQHPEIPNEEISFYTFVPDLVRWPVLVLAILASMAGSQTIISSTFSVISQSESLGCFPRVKVVRMSDKIRGQIYIPEINWILMFICLSAALGLGDARKLGNASGLAVIGVMMVTTSLTSVVMILCWRRSAFISVAFLVVFGSIEGFYLSASLVKFLEGAWFPILLSITIMGIMYVWHYVTLKKHTLDMESKVPLDWLLALDQNLGVARVPGIGIVFSDLVSGVPANFTRFVTNLLAYHQVLVFLCIKYVTVPYVPPTERYLIGRVGPPAHRSYRCIVRYGYRDVHQDIYSFEMELVASLAKFIQLACDSYEQPRRSSSSSEISVVEENLMRTVTAAPICPSSPGKKRVRFAVEVKDEDTGSDPNVPREVREELAELELAEESGITFILGRSHVKSKPGSSVAKKLVIDVAYSFLRRNCRGPDVYLQVPPASLLEVGVVYVL